MENSGTTPPLPGELPTKDKIKRMIRVNHAGEYGAKRIYAGQIAILGGSSCGDTLRHMEEQEQEHLDYFSDIMVKRQVRPTALMPLWHIGGFALGAATAIMGEKAAMACTVAVEKVIDDHYAGQEQELSVINGEAELKENISKFREDEREHHDTAIENGAEQSPFYNLLTGAVSLNTKLAIWLSTRV